MTSDRRCPSAPIASFAVCAEAGRCPCPRSRGWPHARRPPLRASIPIADAPYDRAMQPVPMRVPGARAPHGADIVCVGFAEWDAELPTNQHHLMSRLAHTNRVLFVESLGLRRPQLAVRDVRRMRRRLRDGLRG